MAIWERQSDEKGKPEPIRWYNRFVIYREMGPDRSLLGAYKLFLVAQNGEGEPGRNSRPVKAPSPWTRECERWQWKVRAEAWDMENIRRKELEWAERRRQVQEADFADGQKLRELVQEFVALFPQFREVHREEKPQPDGTMEVVITQRVNATMGQLAGALKTASDMQRVTTGLETERKETKLSGSVGVAHSGEVSVVERTPWDQLEEALDRAVAEVEMAEAEELGAVADKATAEAESDE